MRRQETKPAVYPITRQQRSVLQSSIETIELVWPYQPHPLQARFIALAVWEFDGEYEITAMQHQLIGVMGVLMQQCARQHHEPFREQLLAYHQSLSNLFSLLQNLRNAEALFSHPA